MKLLGLLEQTIFDYKLNLVLIIPQLLATVIQFLVSVSRKILPTMITSHFMVNGLMDLLGVFSLAVDFLVFLAQASMTGRVILAGRTNLKDGWKGLRQYFWPVVGVGLAVVLFGAGLLIPITIIGLAYTTLRVPKVLGQVDLLGFVFGWGAFFVTPLMNSILYIFLAPVILDGLNSGGSIGAGWSAAKENGTPFLALVGLGFLMEVVVFLLSKLNNTVAAQAASLAVYGVEWLTAILATLPVILFTPLLMLIAFRIYKESNAAQNVKAREAQKSIAYRESEQTNVCRCCGGRIPQSAKYCPSCGTKIVEEQKVCRCCGGTIPQGAKYCTSCGTKIV